MYSFLLPLCIFNTNNPNKPKIGILGIREHILYSFFLKNDIKL